MKHFQNLTILITLIGLFGCTAKRTNDPLFDTFKAHIESKGMIIDSVDNTGLIYISQNNSKLTVNLENVRRDYARDKDETYISDLVQTIISNSTEIPTTRGQAKDSIFLSLFPNDFDFQDAVHNQITGEFSNVYVYRGQDNLTWITRADLTKWNISESDLHMQANINANKLLENTPISFDTVGSRKLALIEVEQTTLKAALLFAPAMRERIKAELGFPFYAVIPVRDFCYIFSEKDFDFFSGRLGKVVVNEYKTSGYPITTEILKFSEQGVQAVFKYPIE
jgi:hypothetical protein